MKRTFLFVLCSTLILAQASAQNKKVAKDSYAMRVIKDSVYDKPFFQRPMTVSLNLGTLGIGAATTVKFQPHWFLQLGVNVIPVSVNNYTTKVDGVNTGVTLNSTFVNIHLLAQWQPSLTASWFRVAGGIGYIPSGKVSGSVAPQNDETFGNTTITKDEIGQLNASVDWTGLAPYLGISLLKGVPRNHFNVTVDLGCYYLTSVKAEMSGTKLLSDNSANSQQFNDNMKSWHFLPTLQVNFNYKLH